MVQCCQNSMPLSILATVPVASDGLLFIYFFSPVTVLSVVQVRPIFSSIDAQHKIYIYIYI